jgi:hypothetical protein
MTAIGTAEKIQQLFEPAARAARRGDPGQMRKVLDELHGIWTQSRRKRKKVQAAEELARGMTYALEGVLGVILATAGADARRALVEGRKYALPILHALGKKAREAASAGKISGSGAYSDAAAIQKGRLAKIVGMLPQNIGELIQAMSNCDLITVSGRGTANHVALTDTGAQMLEAIKPGWQIMQVDRDPLGRRLEEGIQAAVRQYKEIIYPRDLASPNQRFRRHLSCTVVAPWDIQEKPPISLKNSGRFVIRKNYNFIRETRAQRNELRRLTRIGISGLPSKVGNQT